MVAVMFVVVTATELTQDCAKADGVTKTTSSGRTKIQRARRFRHMVRNRNDPRFMSFALFCACSPSTAGDLVERCYSRQISQSRVADTTALTFFSARIVLGRSRRN